MLFYNYNYNNNNQTRRPQLLVKDRVKHDANAKEWTQKYAMGAAVDPEDDKPAMDA
jgi:hypothetical protein